MTNATISILQWQDVKAQARATNPHLTELFEQIPGVDQFEVVRMRYAFGMNVVKNGEFYINHNGDNVPLTAVPSLSKKLAPLFDYFWLGSPLGMIMHNSFESYQSLDNQIIPARLLKTGSLLSLTTVFNQENAPHLIPGLFSAIAGCRSLLCLSSLADQAFNARLTQKLGIEHNLCPKIFIEQWDLFKEIVDCESLASEWSAEILFFSKSFMQGIVENPTIKSTLLEMLWQYTSFNRNQYLYDLVWSHFTDRHLKLAEKNALTVIETVKHVVKLSMPQVLFSTGFAPVTDETAGPINLLLNVFIHIYKIRYNFPIFMAIQEMSSTEPLYYSLQRHTFLHSIPQKIGSTHTVKDILLIKEIIEKFQHHVLSGHGPCKLEDTTLYRSLKTTQFDYYHPQSDTIEVSANPEALINEDPRFMYFYNVKKQAKHLIFPKYSKFFHGCIRIQQKTVK